MCDAQAHRAANGGAYPETMAVNLWGLDAIKTKARLEAQNYIGACWEGPAG